MHKIKYIVFIILLSVILNFIGVTINVLNNIKNKLKFIFFNSISLIKYSIFYWCLNIAIWLRISIIKLLSFILVNLMPFEYLKKQTKIILSKIYDVPTLLMIDLKNKILDKITSIFRFETPKPTKICYLI